MFYVLTSIICEIRDGFTNNQARFETLDADRQLLIPFAAQEYALSKIAAPIVWVLILVFGLDDKRRFDADSAPFLANVPKSRELFERLLRKRPGFSSWTWRFDLLFLTC